MMISISRDCRLFLYTISGSFAFMIMSHLPAVAQPYPTCDFLSYLLTQKGECNDLTDLSRQGDADRWKLITADSQYRTYVKPNSRRVQLGSKISIRSRKVLNAATYGIQGSDFQVTIDCKSKGIVSTIIASFNSMGEAMSQAQESSMLADALKQGKLDSTLETMIARHLHSQQKGPSGSDSMSAPRPAIGLENDQEAIRKFVCHPNRST